MTRGDVVEVRLPARRGREQAGRRYAVVLQAEALLGLSTVLVAPTSRRAAPASFRPEVDVRGERTRVLVEQIRAVDLERIGEVAGHLAFGELDAVEDAARTVLDLR